ncbi:MAG TPA: protein kinase [Anaerolineae bacterium]
MTTIAGERQHFFSSIRALVVETLIRDLISKCRPNTPTLVTLENRNSLPQELVRCPQDYAMTSTLKVEGVIRSYSLEPYQNTFAILFEDIGAESLTRLRASGKLSLQAEPLERFLKIALQIAQILGEIHENGVIHKDINPSNIVLNPDTRQLKVIDFGISTRLPPKILSFAIQA